MRYKIKVFAVLIAMIFTLPFSLHSLLMYKVFKTERSFAFYGQLFSFIPGYLGQFIRASFYKITLEECGYDLAVNIGSFFAHPSARVGKGVGLSAYSIVGTATLQDNVMISARVSILSGKYQHGAGLTGDIAAEEEVSDGIRYERVVIGENTWIGEGAITMASVGKNCVVSAGSVVTKDMPDDMLAIGNPARFMKR
jgi:acetyltransferase-like isoleucine patch superfamily enzyme